MLPDQDAVVGIPNDQLADYVNADLTAEVPQNCLYADKGFFQNAAGAGVLLSMENDIQAPLP